MMNAINTEECGHCGHGRSVHESRYYRCTVFEGVGSGEGEVRCPCAKFAFYGRRKDEWAIEFDQEDDGRWLAAISGLPGVMCYGETKLNAAIAVCQLAARVEAEKIAHGEV